MAGKTVVEAQAERLLKALALLEEGAYVVTARSVFVYSDQPGVAGHTVDLDAMRCDCPDATVGWAHRNGIDCKHEELARIVRERADQYAGATGGVNR
jgi:hypothetical protein